MRANTQTDRRQALMDKLLDGNAKGAQETAAIPRRADGVAPPLSFSQSRFWFLDRLAPGNPFYIESLAVQMSPGSVSADILEQAINAVVQRHEILRTGFRDENSGPVQIVSPHLHVPLSITDLTGLDQAEQDAKLARLLQQQATHSFDLSATPLLRTILIRRESGDTFSLAVHHIISDGWSMRIFSREVSAMVTALNFARVPDLSPLAIQYGDYAAWQRSSSVEAHGKKSLAFWCDQLKNLPTLDMPLDFPRPQVLGFRGAYLDVALPPNVSAGLRALAVRQRATMFMTALAAFAVILGRHTGQHDIVIGSPVAGRSRAELEPLIGLFLNTIIVRIDLSGNPGFRALLSRVRQTVLAAFDHQDTPFEALVDALHPERELGRNPLFQVLFQFFTPQDKKAGASDQAANLVSVDKGAAILDLSFHLWDSPKGIVGRLEYSTELFEQNTIARIFTHFSTFLSAAVSAPDRPIFDLEIFSPEERQQILAFSRGARTALTEKGTLLSAFDQRLQSTPDKIALINSTEQTTYACLNRRANQFGGLLIDMGVTRGDLVVVCLERSVNAIAAMLGVIKAGAAFVPVDPGYPQARVRYIIADSGAKVAVTRSVHLDLFGTTACLAVDDPKVEEILATNTRNFNDPGLLPLDIVYAIYTSGSTGQPKAVMGTHQATINRFNWMWREYPFSADEVACHKTAIAFVDAVWEIFGPILAGIPLLIVTDTVARDPRALCQTLGEHQVTRLLLVPSLLSAILDSRIDLLQVMPALRWCFTSGERLSRELVARYEQSVQDDVRLVNLYGSSELAGDVSCAEIKFSTATKDVDPPIGVPLDNCCAYVLDPNLQLMPDGTTGDLYLSGLHLARGYFGRPGMTAERFLPNPFAITPGERLFATGDRARRLPDGNLIFHGRIDHQIKLRGHRIELGEIETALQSHPDVAQAVANITDDDTGGRVDAWIIPSEDAASPVDTGSVRRHLALSLPAYMVPATLTVLNTLPLMNNGKVDRLALTPNQKIDKEKFVAAQTEVETMLCALWSELLDHPMVSATDDFFEIGGHSLLATRLITQIRDRTGVDLPLTAVFLHPTVIQLASQIENILVAQVDSLSDEEVRRLLHEEQQEDY